MAFPLEEVSAHSRREKNVRHGHISTLHIWWARRPLAACRAFIYASLVNDPDTDAEREDLLKEVADLASWDAVRHPERVSAKKGRKAVAGLQARNSWSAPDSRILEDNDGSPPKLLDPFAGGGAIPLEGLRLGCEVEASDLNPVAVLILKGTVEYPQKYGQPDSRPVPDYIRQAAEDPSQGRFNDGDLDSSLPPQSTGHGRPLLGKLDAPTGTGGAGRVLPPGPRRQRTGGLPLEPHHPMSQTAKPRCPLFASTGWHTKTRKGLPWNL